MLVLHAVACTVAPAPTPAAPAASGRASGGAAQPSVHLSLVINALEALGVPPAQVEAVAEALAERTYIPLEVGCLVAYPHVFMLRRRGKLIYVYGA